MVLGILVKFLVGGFIVDDEELVLDVCVQR